MAKWERDGETVIDSGEIAGMDPPTWGPEDSDFQNEIVGDDFTAYYKKGANMRAGTTYYVVRTMSWNQPEPEVVWVIEELTWVGTTSGPDEDVQELDRMYESASPLYYDSAESALREARRFADSDESDAFL